ncbi:SAM-dependent methyltransferase, partial [Halorubrum sp. SD683]|uniref:SAM-dependent methyltransferase n=1 Tax=Halorubrum sp. SD683 TaxID=1855873 RepID=UPI000A2D6A06
ESVGGDTGRGVAETAREAVPGARLGHGEMWGLPVAADRCDAGTAYHAGFNVERERHPEVYAEFARVRRPGGRLLTTLPGGRFETVRRGWMGGEMFFSAPGRERTLDQLRAAGFTEVETPTATDPLGSSTEFALATLGETPDREANS